MSILKDFSYQYCKQVVEILNQSGIELPSKEVAWSAVFDDYDEDDFVYFIKDAVKNHLISYFRLCKNKEVSEFLNLIYRVEIRDGEFYFIYIKELEFFKSHNVITIEIGAIPKMDSLILTLESNQLYRIIFKMAFEDISLLIEPINELLPESCSWKLYRERLIKILSPIAQVKLPDQNEEHFYNYLPLVLNNSSANQSDRLVLENYIDEPNLQCILELFSGQLDSIQNAPRDSLYHYILILKEELPSLFYLPPVEDKKAREILDTLEVRYFCVCL